MNYNRNTLNRILTTDDIARIAPSVVAEHASSKVSDQYQFIPTIDVVNSLRSEGWNPVMVTEQRVKNPDRRGFQKHMLRFRQDANSADLLNVGDSIVELVLTNGHDGTTAYTLHAGLFRLVCSNGLVIADATFEKISIVHKGFQPSQVIEASYKVVNKLPLIAGAVESMRSLQLTSGERQAFAESAIQLKYEKAEDAPIQAPRLLESWRPEDKDPNLWNTFNVVQENLIKGGQRGRRGYSRATTREVKGIDANVKLNKALWSLAEKMKELKAA